MYGMFPSFHDLDGKRFQLHGKLLKMYIKSEGIIRTQYNLFSKLTPHQTTNNTYYVFGGFSVEDGNKSQNVHSNQATNNPDEMCQAKKSLTKVIHNRVLRK